MKSYEQWKKENSQHLDTDNVTQYSKMSGYNKEQIKLQLNALYGNNEERYIKHLYRSQDEKIQQKDKIIYGDAMTMEEGEIIVHDILELTINKDGIIMKLQNKDKITLYKQTIIDIFEGR